MWGRSAVAKVHAGQEGLDNRQALPRRLCSSVNHVCVCVCVCVCGYVDTE